VNAAVTTDFLLGGCAALVYGLLDVISPSLTIRWQVRATAKHGGSGQTVGTGFQRVLGIDPDAEPWDDPVVKRKVRWIGFVLSLFGLAVAATGSWMFASR
jgi:hypothetical protein